MTEQEWAECTSAKRMIIFLGLGLREEGSAYQGCASARKHRLFAVACCRRAWHLVVEGRGRQTVEVAEQYADGRATPGEVAEALRLGRAARVGYGWNYTFPESARGYAWQAAMIAADGDGNLELAAQLAAHADLLRDVYGPLPFRPLTLDPAWATPTVLQLAQAAYEERQLPEGTLDPTHLAVLADALEESGCTSADILGHLRGPGPHVRGCFALDLVLGKK